MGSGAADALPTGVPPTGAPPTGKKDFLKE
jgi:hypothetical protein